MAFYSFDRRIINPSIKPWGYSYLFTPADITTALWLDAADSETITLASGAVSRWADKSGYSRHATQADAASRPAYNAIGLNSLPTLAFDDTNDGLQLPDSWGTHTSHSFFSVTSPSSTGDRRYVFISGQSLEIASSLLLIASRNNNQQVGYFDGVNWSGTAAATTGPQIIEWVLDGNGGSGATYRNGNVLQSSLTYAAQTLQSGIRIGSRTEGGATNFYNGNISEVLVVPSAVDNTTRQKLEGYLAHKWLLTGNLPSDHPYKTRAPRA